MLGRAAGLLLCLILAAGCAGVVPPALQKEITPGLTLAQVRQAPAAHQDQTVLWGGRIIRAVNKPNGTLIEVLALPLDAQDRPQNSYDSPGRFIVSMAGFLDPEIYHHGREVTVVGRIVGVQALPVGEVNYDYVLLRGREVKLWDRRPEYQRLYPAPFWGPLPGAVYPYWYYRPYYWW
ncbi:MAG: Slp family lipoprotein [Thermodesulfobacteriota bacterium]